MMRTWNGRLAALAAIGLALSSGVARASYVDELNLIAGADRVSYWNLQETSGTTAADSWDGFDGSNPGTYSGAGYTLGVAGPRPDDGFLGFSASNNAVNFAGDSTQLLQMATTGYAGQQSLTMLFWFNIPNGQAGQRYYGGLSDPTEDASGRYGFGVNSNTNVRGFMRIGDPAESDISSGTNGVQSPNAPANYRNGDWHFLAMTMGADGSDKRLTIFVDGDERWTGVIANGENLGGLSARTTSALAFGRDLGDVNDSGRPFVGRLDEISFIGRALTGGEVAGLYQAALVPEPGTIVLAGVGLLGLALLRKKAAK